MKKYLVYKFTNQINNFCYIGITSSPIERRIKRHLNDSEKDDGLYFHRALSKYGIQNFTVEILEDNILEEEIDEKEKYYIKLYDSFFLNGKGYNMTTGGRDGSFCKRILSDNDIKQIQDKLRKDLNKTALEISKEYNISYSLVSDINTGRVWRNPDIKYPIRENNTKKITKEEFLKIIQMLQSKLFSTIEIANKIGTSTAIVSKINTGDYKKFTYPDNIEFPIVNRKINNSKIDTLNVLNLLLDYLKGTFSYRELSQKYNISISYVKGIIVGNNLDNITYDCMFPLKENLQFNENLIKSKKKFLEEI